MIKKLLALLPLLVCLVGANYRTPNFSVDAPTPEFAQQIGQAAEYYRSTLSVAWIGQQLPNWSQQCPIQVVLTRGNGGQTSYVCDQGEVHTWRMHLQGTPQRILDSILPHEVTHTIFASYFRRPLPRWADEGGSCTVEARPEYERNVVVALKTGRGIPFKYMLETMEYPQDCQAFYAQSHSVAQWLIEQRGRQHFVYFVERALNTGSWATAIRECYGYESIPATQQAWNDWVRAGRPAVGKQRTVSYYKGRWQSYQALPSVPPLQQPIQVLPQQGSQSQPEAYVTPGPAQPQPALVSPAYDDKQSEIEWQRRQQQQLQVAPEPSSYPGLTPSQPGAVPALQPFQQSGVAPAVGDCQWIKGADGNVYRCCDGNAPMPGTPTQFPATAQHPHNGLEYPTTQPPLQPSYPVIPPSWEPGQNIPPYATTQPPLVPSYPINPPQIPPTQPIVSPPIVIPPYVSTQPVLPGVLLPYLLPGVSPPIYTQPIYPSWQPVWPAFQPVYPSLPIVYPPVQGCDCAPKWAALNAIIQQIYANRNTDAVTIAQLVAARNALEAQVNQQGYEIRLLRDRQLRVAVYDNAGRLVAVLPNQ